MQRIAGRKEDAIITGYFVQTGDGDADWAVLHTQFATVESFRIAGVRPNRRLLIQYPWAIPIVPVEGVLGGGAGVTFDRVHLSHPGCKR